MCIETWSAILLGKYTYSKIIKRLLDFTTCKLHRRHYHNCINQNEPCIHHSLVWNHRRVVCGGTRRIRCYRSCGWNLRKSSVGDISSRSCACSRSLQRKVRPCCTFHCFRSSSTSPGETLIPLWRPKPARLTLSYKRNAWMICSISATRLKYFWALSVLYKLYATCNIYLAIHYVHIIR